MTGSTDNFVSIYKSNGQFVTNFNDHIHFVQGVAWDPLGKFLASQSSDRTTRIYKRKTPKGKDFVTNQVLKYLDFSEAATNDESSSTTTKKNRLFLSDGVASFFRRLCWSPDGSLLFTPCAIYQPNSDVEPINTTYVWSRHNLAK